MQGVTTRSSKLAGSGLSGDEYGRMINEHNLSQKAKLDDAQSVKNFLLIAAARSDIVSISGASLLDKSLNLPKTKLVSLLLKYSCLRGGRFN